MFDNPATVPLGPGRLRLKDDQALHIYTDRCAAAIRPHLVRHLATLPEDDDRRGFFIGMLEKNHRPEYVRLLKRDVFSLMIGQGELI